MSATEAQRRWGALTSHATLGTNRTALSAETLWPVTEPPPPSGSPERNLLRMAAMNYLWLLAGARQAKGAGATVEAAPESDERFVSETAAWRLGRMLGGDRRELVPEWFALAARAGVALPPQWLPTVLDRLQPAERSAARVVLGRRAEWLAKRNPEWSFTIASEGPSEERWNHGSLEERAAELRSLHALDATRAREWLDGTWKTESPEARAAFMAVLAESPALSDADEPFLEASLNDKRKDVRRAAAAGLRRLPASAHAARNLARLQPLVVLEAGGSGLLSKLRKRRLEIQLPEALTKADLRDGIEQTPPPQRKIGERAWWLMQMVAMAPPSHWTGRFDCDIATFMNATQATDYPLDLLLALAAAVASHPDVAWIADLSGRLVAQEWEGAYELWVRVDGALRGLVAATPPDQRREIVQRIFDATPDARFAFVISAYEAAGLPWDEAVTRRAFGQLAREALAGDDRPHTGGSYPVWARLADVNVARRMLDDTLERLKSDSPWWRRQLEGLRDILQFRADMQQELLK